MQPLIRILTLMFVLCSLVGVRPACADCDWPPLNAVEQRQSNPVQIGGHAFMTGFYSYVVASYHVDHLHCTTSVNIGPRQWAIAVGLGGAEPIGPRVSSNAHPASTPSSSASMTTMAPLSALPPTPAQPLAMLPPLPTLSGLSTLPALPSLSRSENSYPH